MPWQAAPGCTLLIPSGPNSKKHLHVVLLGPVVLPSYGNAQQLVFVSVTTLNPGMPFDPTCVIAPSEHEFVKHESWIAYRYMRVDSEAHARERVGEHVWHEHAPCSNSLLQRILEGVCTSRFTNGEFRRLFGC